MHNISLYILSLSLSSFTLVLSSFRLLIPSFIFLLRLYIIMRVLRCSREPYFSLRSPSLLLYYGLILLFAAYPFFHLPFTSLCCHVSLFFLISERASFSLPCVFLLFPLLLVPFSTPSVRLKVCLREWMYVCVCVLPGEDLPGVTDTSWWELPCIDGRFRWFIVISTFLYIRSGRREKGCCEIRVSSV